MNKTIQLERKLEITPKNLENRLKVKEGDDTVTYIAQIKGLDFRWNLAVTGRVHLTKYRLVKKKKLFSDETVEKDVREWSISEGGFIYSVVLMTLFGEAYYDKLRYKAREKLNIDITELLPQVFGKLNDKISEVYKQYRPFYNLITTHQ